MKILNFLFGKRPPIFNEEGRVEHEMKKSLWSKWKKRYTEGREYDWKKHSGMRYNPETPFKNRDNKRYEID